VSERGGSLDPFPYQTLRGRIHIPCSANTATEASNSQVVGAGRSSVVETSEAVPQRCGISSAGSSLQC
jgi:hypothetical protein